LRFAGGLPSLIVKWTSLNCELHNEGATDLLATPLIFTDGDAHAALWTTREPGGFSTNKLP
jgi:hypothetical protein